MLHFGKDLLTDLYKCFLKFKENVRKYGKANNNFLLGTCWDKLFRDVQFLQEPFHRLINYINRLIVRFENTSQEFYFYMKIFHSGTNFEKPEKKRVN